MEVELALHVMELVGQVVQQLLLQEGRAGRRAAKGFCSDPRAARLDGRLVTSHTQAVAAAAHRRQPTARPPAHLRLLLAKVGHLLAQVAHDEEVDARSPALESRKWKSRLHLDGCACQYVGRRQVAGVG